MKKHLNVIKASIICLIAVLFASLPFQEMPIYAIERQTSGVAALQNNISENILNPFQKSDLPENYELVSETAEAVLYSDMESGNFIFGDKAGQKLWYSIPNDLENDELTIGSRRSQIRSMLLVEYVDMRTVATSTVPEMLASYRDSVEYGDAEVKKIENGIRIEYNFADYGIWIPLEITLNDSALSVRVKTSELKQTSYNQVRTIHVLPCFTAAGITEQGYLFIPDGSGAIAQLNNTKGDITDYNGTVYGFDRALEQKERPELEQNVIMPVFGIKTGDHALTGIIVEGDEISEIYANISGEGIGYNRIYPKMVTAVSDSTTLFEADYFNMREIFRLETREKLEDYEVRYYSLSGEQANYAGMAENYRSYLLENGLLSKKATKPALNVDIYGAAEKQASFLGIPYQKLFAMTTFEQAKDFAAQLKEDGAENLVIRYSGWNNHGLKNKKIPTKAKPLSVLGGKSNYLALQDYLDSIGAEFYSDVDLINIQKSGNSFSILSDVSMSMFNTRVQQYEYLRSVYVPSLESDPWYLLKPQMLGEAADKFFSSFLELNSSGSVCLNGVGSMLYSDFDKNGVDRTGALKHMQTMLKKHAETTLSVEQGNAYTYPYVNRIFSLPATASASMMFDDSVPFAQIVLHGFMPYSTEDINRSVDPVDAVLHCIETGSDPYFCGMYEDSFILMETTYNDLYSSSFSNWYELALDAYQKYSSVYDTLYDKAIVSHSEVAASVYQTVFEDGTSILVNYNDADQIIDGVTVEAKSFTLKGAR